MLTFYEMVTPEDQHVNISLGIVSMGENVFYRIIRPKGSNGKSGKGSYKDSYSGASEESNLDSAELPMVRNVSEKFEDKGLYTIQVYNRGSEPVQFSILSNPAKKLPKTNENIIELRSILDSIQASVKELENENYYARNIQATNISEAKRIKKTLNWLVLCPIFTFGIAVGKYMLARQLVRPKGKRFKGLF